MKKAQLLAGLLLTISVFIPIGKVTSDLAVFDTFSGNEEITFQLAE